MNCSRCTQTSADVFKHEGVTGGYYEAEAWTQFANPGETIICDKCMHADPRYQEVYGLVQ